MLTNILRLSIISIYPIILCFLFFCIYKIYKYQLTIKKHWRDILLNTCIVSLILISILIVFFKFEDTIYVYDYSGHWIRSLKLRKLFFEAPNEILPLVYHSMNFDDYSYLPGLFSLWSMIFKTSYGYFCVASCINFFIPIVILGQILYFTYYENHARLPIVAAIGLYPLYLTLFYGEIDLGGMIFILVSLMLTIFRSFDEISIFDNIAINIFAFISIFYRRWYLYSLIVFYLCYFIKYIFHYKKKILSNDGIKDFIKIISSGFLMLVVILLFFKPFLTNVLTNNYDEAYSFYDRDGKIFNFINYISILIIIISAYGLFKLIKKDRLIALIFILCIIIPTAMFWSIQSFEKHHFYIILLYILFLFVIGLNNLFNNRVLKIIITILLLFQTSIVFTKAPFIPIITSTRKTPEILEYKDKIIDLTYYLKSIITEDWQSAYLASTSAIISDDMLRNSILPDLDAPQIDTAVLDLRDGFPKDMQFIQYVITIDPIQYLDKDYQHIYTIISNAIWNEPVVQQVYTEIYQTKLDNMTIKVYEKTGVYSQEIKEYFYNEIIKCYPDKTEFFSYILD